MKRAFKLIIPIAPVTKKNSQRIIRLHNRPCIVPSKAYKAFEDAAMYYVPRMQTPLTGRYNVQAVYYMPTRRRVDLVNLQEATLDILVKGGMLADDNSGIVVSMDGSRVCYDRARPRTEVYITEAEE